MWLNKETKVSTHPSPSLWEKAKLNLWNSEWNITTVWRILFKSAFCEIVSEPKLYISYRRPSACFWEQIGHTRWTLIHKIIGHIFKASILVSKLTLEVQSRRAFSNVQVFPSQNKSTFSLGLSFLMQTYILYNKASVKLERDAVLWLPASTSCLLVVLIVFQTS